MSYLRAKAEAIGKARALKKTAYEIADIEALRYNLNEAQRLRLRDEVAWILARNHKT